MTAGTVLYVDDDRDFADLVEIRLARDIDGDVEAVTTLEDAMARLDGGDVDCLVLDYRLSETDGEESYAAVREHHPDVPIVFFSGVSDRGTVESLIDAGARAFVTKGVDGFDDLATAVKDATA